MDPDEVYEQMMEAMRDVTRAESSVAVASAADVLADKVLALDGWMRSGGYPPRAWRKTLLSAP